MGTEISLTYLPERTGRLHVTSKLSTSVATRESSTFFYCLRPPQYRLTPSLNLFSINRSGLERDREVILS